METIPNPSTLLSITRDLPLGHKTLPHSFLRIEDRIPINNKLPILFLIRISSGGESSCEIYKLNAILNLLNFNLNYLKCLICMGLD